MKAIPVILLLMIVASSAVGGAAPGESAAMRAFVSEQAVDGYFPLASAAATADVLVAADDWQVAQIAARDLAADVSGTGPPTLGVAREGGDPQTLADLSVYTQGKRFVNLSNTGKGVNGRIVLPVLHPETPARDAVTGFVESHGGVSMDAEHFTRKQARGGAAWEVIKGLGRSGDSVAVFPRTVVSRTEPADLAANSPSLEYQLYLFHSGGARLDLDCLPAESYRR